MNNYFLFLFYVQIAPKALTLLVDLVAVVLAVVNLRRWPKPATLTLTGSAVMIVNSLGVSLAFAYLKSLQRDGDPRETDLLLGILAMGSSLVTACGMMMVVAAVFSGRPAPLYPIEGTPFKKEGPLKG